MFLVDLVCFTFTFLLPKRTVAAIRVPTPSFGLHPVPTFLLVRMDSEKNEREIPANGSVTATVQPKDLIPFDCEKVATGIYKVQLKSDLGPGEYGFLFGGVLQAMGEVWLHDFGIDGGK